MTDEDRPAFAAALKMLAAAFNEPMSPRRVDGYFIGLKDLPIKTACLAIDVALRTWRLQRFPAPVELRKLVPRPEWRRCPIEELHAAIDAGLWGAMTIRVGEPVTPSLQEAYDEGCYVLERDERGMAVAAYHRGAVS